jgi:hypothetical protein
MCSVIALASGCAVSPKPRPTGIPASFLEYRCALPDPSEIKTVGDLEEAYVVAWRCAQVCNAARDALE